ncbi:MAG: chorismate synthase [Clostridia bacterium]|nr:chorismate synthase [Clostridia bacterium]
MKNTFGNNFSVTIAGESHGAGITVIIDGAEPGIELTDGDIGNALSLRRPSGSFSTGRRESDEFTVTSGVFENRTTGTPISIFIKNSDVRSADYDRDFVRPGHADLTARIKYRGFEDYRGGGHFSGRVTAGICAAGAVAGKILAEKGIRVVSRIKRCAGIDDMRIDGAVSDDIFDSLSGKAFPVLDLSAGEKMKDMINLAASAGDSVGGVSETFVFGLRGGIGEPFFDSVESVISHAVFSVPGVKGIEFGGGFALSDMRGSEANDAVYQDGGKICYESNNSGGINGGITNGMPVVFSAAIKPTPSVSVPQKTVRFINGVPENAFISVKGRHDPCIVHRAVHVITAVTSVAILDLYLSRRGYIE